jgi:hypothetical protein
MDLEQSRIPTMYPETIRRLIQRVCNALQTQMEVLEEIVLYNKYQFKES